MKVCRYDLECQKKYGGAALYTAIFGCCCVYKGDRSNKKAPEKQNKRHTVQEDKKMKTYEMELNLNQMVQITGGKTNKNPTPDKLDSGIDLIINGKNYDLIAQWIANWLNGDNTRSRRVNNDVDIYDTDI
jgi:hypothetical protein